MMQDVNKDVFIVNGVYDSTSIKNLIKIVYFQFFIFCIDIQSKINKNLEMVNVNILTS